MCMVLYFCKMIPSEDNKQDQELNGKVFWHMISILAILTCSAFITKALKLLVAMSSDTLQCNRIVGSIACCAPLVSILAIALLRQKWLHVAMLCSAVYMVALLILCGVTSNIGITTSYIVLILASFASIIWPYITLILPKMYGNYMVFCALVVFCLARYFGARLASICRSFTTKGSWANIYDQVTIDIKSYIFIIAMVIIVMSAFIYALHKLCGGDKLDARCDSDGDANNSCGSTCKSKCLLIICGSLLCLSAATCVVHQVKNHNAKRYSNGVKTIFEGKLLDEGCVHISKDSGNAVVIEKDKVDETVKNVITNNDKTIILVCTLDNIPCNKLKKYINNTDSNIVGKVDIVLINADVYRFNSDFSKYGLKGFRSDCYKSNKYYPGIYLVKKIEAKDKSDKNDGRVEVDNKCTYGFRDETKERITKFIDGIEE